MRKQVWIGLMFVLVFINAFSRKESGLYNKWYLTKGEEINTNKGYIGGDCQYLRLKENCECESKGFVREQGKFIVEGDSIHLIDNSDTTHLSYVLQKNDLQIMRCPEWWVKFDRFTI